METAGCVTGVKRSMIGMVIRVRIVWAIVARCEDNDWDASGLLARPITVKRRRTGPHWDGAGTRSGCEPFQISFLGSAQKVPAK